MGLFAFLAFSKDFFFWTIFFFLLKKTQKKVENFINALRVRQKFILAFWHIKASDAEKNCSSWCKNWIWFSNSIWGKRSEAEKKALFFHWCCCQKVLKLPKWTKRIRTNPIRDHQAHAILNSCCYVITLTYLLTISGSRHYPRTIRYFRNKWWKLYEPLSWLWFEIWAENESLCWSHCLFHVHQYRFQAAAFR